MSAVKGYTRWKRRQAEILMFLPPVIDGKRMLRPFVMFGMISTGALTLRLTNMTLLVGKDWAMTTPLEEVVQTITRRLADTRQEPKPLSERVLKAMANRANVRREGDGLR